MTDARSALRRAAEVGEFFSFAVPDGPGWQPLRTLIRHPAERVPRVRDALARSAGVPSSEVSPRTAASIDLQGVVARIVSPALGAATLAQVVPELTLDALRFRPDGQRLGLSAAQGRDVDTAARAAEAIAAHVLATVVVPLVTSYDGSYHVSTKVLWGNVASALNGAAVVLDASGLRQRIAARDVLAELLRAMPDTVLTTTPHFVRNSCCLWYRIPGTALCGDCVLTALPRGAPSARR